MKRTFIALWPPEGVASSIVAASAPWPWPASAKRYAAADLHLTLHFLGPLPQERINALGQGLKCAFEPFTLSLDTAAMWQEGLMVLTPSRIPEPLSRLHQSLADQLRAEGLPVESRRFAPHMTLARACKGMLLPAAFEPVNWTVDDFVLAISTGEAQRRYEVLRQ